MEISKIVIVGCGGNGSWLSLLLTQYMNYSYNLVGIPLVLIDHDTFEERNKIRQFFARPGNKAESLVGTWQKKYGEDLILEAIPKMVVEEEDLPFILRTHSELITPGDFMEENSVVFLCVDKCYPRIAISKYAQTMENVILINGGTANHDWVVDVYMKDGYRQSRTLEKKYPDLLIKAQEERKALLLPPAPAKGMNCTDRMQTDEADQTFLANLSTATTLLQVFCCLLEYDTAPETIMGDVFGITSGIRGPISRPLKPLDLQISL